MEITRPEMSGLSWKVNKRRVLTNYTLSGSKPHLSLNNILKLVHTGDTSAKTVCKYSVTRSETLNSIKKANGIFKIFP